MSHSVATSGRRGQKPGAGKAYPISPPVQGRCSATLGCPKGKTTPSSSSCPVGLRSVPVHAGVHFCFALRRGKGGGYSSSQRTMAKGHSGVRRDIHKVHPAPAATWDLLKRLKSPKSNLSGIWSPP